MPAIMHMTRKELQELIEKTKAAGNDASLLEQLQVETTPQAPVKTRKQPHSQTTIELRRANGELITSPEELDRLRCLACPHIRNSPYWQLFVERRILVGKPCMEVHPGEFGEHRQPPLL